MSILNPFTCPSRREARALPLPVTEELFVPVVVKRKRSGWIRRIQHVQGFAPDIRAELDRVPAAHQRESVEKLRNGCREIRVGRGGRADLLESGDSEDRQHRCEGILRQSGYGDPAVLKRGLVQVAPGIAETKLVQGGGGEHPVVVAGERIAARDRMADHAGRQASAAIGQRSHRSIVVAEKRVASENPVLLTEVAIDAEVRLVLIVGFRRGSNEVVGA